MDARILARFTCVGVIALVSAAAFGQPKDPVKEAKDERLATSDRVRAVERAWQTDKTREARREDLKSILWIQRSAVVVRVRCLELLMDDPGDTDHADTRSMLRLMVPTEGDFAVLEAMCRIIERERWPEFAGPLVRSYSRFVVSRPDDERPERRALAALAGARPVEELVYEVFSTPATGTGQQRDREDKARSAAWELLGRLDKSGAKRKALIEQAAAAPSDDPMLQNVRFAATELRAIPLTASQLTWVGQIRESAAKSPEWMTELRAALAACATEHLADLRLRHLEPIRWASLHQPDWLRADRPALLSQLHARLKGRTIYQRTQGDTTSEAVSERLSTYESRLTWADLLSMLVIDVAVRTPGLAETLWDHVERDLKDRTTELGGLISADGGGFKAVLYPPRGTARTGDRRFVASDDMLAAGALALAHYHFHAQSVDNADYAGPGPGDMEYADDQGRLCLVFTPVRRGVLNVDYYQAGGVRIDLGTITAATK